MDNEMSKLEQIMALKNGKGIQYLLNTAYEILGNPIVIHNMEYKFIACTENIVIDDPLWNELITSGSYSSESIEFFKNECFIDAIANARTITLLTSNKLKYDRLFGKIFNEDNITVAYVNMIAINGPVEEDYPEIWEAFCRTLSKEVEKSEFYKRYGQIYQNTIIRKLIEGSIEDKRLYTGHVANIYQGLKQYLYLAVVEIVQRDPGHSVRGYFLDMLKKSKRSFKYTIYSNYIIIIISSDNAKLNLKKSFNSMKEPFKQNNIYMGISSRFDNLFELQKYYREAVDALKCGLENDRNQWINLYDEIRTLQSNTGL